MTSSSQNRSVKNIKYVGTRPKNDQDNHCRELLSDLVRDYGCFYEISPENLYLIHLGEGKRLEDFHSERVKDYENCPFIFWFFEDDYYFTYEDFNMDFGPFNLAVSHLFCSRLKVWLDTKDFRDPDKYIVIVTDDSDSKRNLNLKLLVAIAAIVLLNMTDQEVIDRLNFFMLHKSKPLETKKEFTFKEKKKFSDVSGIYTAFSLTLEDCIRGFYASLKLKWYDFYDFDHGEYLFYETVMSGDLNWIVPNKIVAFAGPKDDINQELLYYKHSPKFYYNYFKSHNVTTIIRLNEPEYDSSGFTDFGFDHHDLIFPDGFPPTSTIAAKFIKIVDEAKGAVAVHCYAGIGRTGTLIAAYLMARYNFTAQMAIAWTRICRPGSVIGDQQDWLYTRFDPYSVDTKNRRCKHKQLPISTFTGNNQSKSTNNEDKMEIDSSQSTGDKISSYAIAEKTYGQAKALMLAKKKRDKTSSRNSMKKTESELDAAKRASKSLDIFLNLGKTLPYAISAQHIDELEKGEFYHIKDNKYEWKVIFPKNTYVTLRYRGPKDQKSQTQAKTPVYRSMDNGPEFRYEPDGEIVVHTSKGRTLIQTLRPVVYFSAIND